MKNSTPSQPPNDLIPNRRHNLISHKEVRDIPDMQGPKEARIVLEVRGTPRLSKLTLVGI